MNKLLITALSAMVATLSCSIARGESLLLANVAHGKSLALPVRGLTMADVERRHGAPLQKLATVGGGSAKQPPINRWRYAGYTVVFERDRVIHSVADATPR